MELVGVTLLNNSFVDFDDIPSLFLGGGGAQDSDNVLLCHTDLIQCCNAVLVGGGVSLGEWYYPNGTIIAFDSVGATFRRNRGQSVVRLWRRDNPPERGRFHCCLLYTSPSPRDATLSRMPSSA